MYQIKNTKVVIVAEWVLPLVSDRHRLWFFITRDVNLNIFPFFDTRILLKSTL